METLLNKLNIFVRSVIISALLLCGTLARGEIIFSEKVYTATKVLPESVWQKTDSQTEYYLSQLSDDNIRLILDEIADCSASRINDNPQKSFELSPEQDLIVKFLLQACGMPDILVEQLVSGSYATQYLKYFKVAPCNAYLICGYYEKNRKYISPVFKQFYARLLALKEVVTLYEISQPDKENYPLTEVYDSIYDQFKSLIPMYYWYRYGNGDLEMMPPRDIIDYGFICNF